MEVVHGDVSATNFLFSQQTGDVKVIDLGMAAKLGQPLPVTGNKDYLRRERCSLADKNEKSPVTFGPDRFALGLVCFEILCPRNELFMERKAKIREGYSEDDIKRYIAPQPFPGKEIIQGLMADQLTAAEAANKFEELR